ncbi:nickel ABC transporter ATP-binding protein NikE [Polymorphobacter fuscus]|uniref:Nickel ABC transporter ATP-binding protein NikE n=1 Tax=Sandarakinorhabdus fusca TaxID=1439888 RepID=A0A7C9GMV6_9SPHN|nr:ABC transporter ATP-binding protein [Polymorphobacter fuscus]KAB7648659.1 ABC transporter ATP-binding protein [Polymorphobacter fuscus]MQT16215.1 nickel ABC transporter ATP-binding protein NikE [Polymorphobacter fuscus]NJC07500.1 peptide/nickel transport system ATP-binding protein [Polymorphobacter fuscus]
MTGARPALSVRGLSVALPPGADRQWAVEDMNFDVRRGETLCLVGASGSGKSVLAAAMMAALPPGLAITRGSITLGAQTLTALGEPALRRLRGNRIALVPQEPVPALNPLQQIGKQVEEVLLLHSGLDAGARARRTDELLASVALDPAVARRTPHQLSGGECQRVAIAMAIAMAPDVIIADEATTALDTVTQAQILDLLAALKARGDHGLVFISHDIAVVAAIADRIAVLDAGRIVEIGPARAVLESPRHAVTQAMLAASRPPPMRRPRPEAPPVLIVDGLTKSVPNEVIIAGAGFVVAAGTTTAIVGASGSGKSTLARLIMRIVPADRGSITIDGVAVRALRGAASRAARGLVQMVFQDSFSAFNPRRSIGCSIARAAELAGASPVDARARAVSLLARVGMPVGAFDRLPAAFSGGQRQRIAIARALAMQPRLLICDESVSGLDPVVQAQVLALLDDLQAETGVAILFITHDLRTAAAIADRILVLDRGMIVEAGDAATVLRHPQSAAALALVTAIPLGGLPDAAA